MPPRDENGDYIVKPMRYLRLLAICLSLGSALGGGAVGFWSAAVSHGRELAEAEAQRETVKGLVKTVSELADTQRAANERLAMIEMALKGKRTE